MRLKSLELKGFKSFANPTTLHFDENVTGVVGPNGSGKSNVVDAFRWVLGEQSHKDLRLEQMGDVLFNGAVNKAQANLAEVSVTFDNSKNILPTEFDHVKISRRLYRNGDSEYRINDVVCRLKDIQALFLDTGIGSDSYSIIELGMVDDILHDKDNARRRMFEQAAGISKFKKRKKETIQKLKLTNADLERIEDLLFEIETNLKDLEKQARRTKRFFEIKAKYKTASIQLHKLKWDAIGEEEKAIHIQITEEKTDHSSISAEMNASESILAEEKQKNLVEEKNLSEYQRALNELIDTIRQLENEKNLLSQKIKYAQSNIEKAQTDIQKTEPILETSNTKEAQIAKRLKVKEAEFERETNSLEKANAELKSTLHFYNESKASQESHNKSIQACQSQIFEADKSLAVLKNQKNSFGLEIEQIQNQASEADHEILKLQEDIKGRHVKLKILESEIEVLKEKEANRKDLITKGELEIRETKDEVSKHNRAKDALENERKLLISMVENLEGFSESVKYLHQNWKGKKVLLSDIINTKEEYRAAVEQFLQPYLNYFIVQNTNEAQLAISMLKSAQKGKAQFFLLDAIPDQTHGIEINLLPLSQIIETDAKYQTLIKLICNNVYLVDNTSEYDHLLEEYPITLLDKKGSFVRKQFSLTGGSVGLFEGKKIGRKKRIEELGKNIDKVAKNVGRLEEKLAKQNANLKEIKSSNFEEKIDRKSQERFEVEKQIASLNSNLLNFLSNLEKSKNRKEDIEGKLMEIDDQISDKELKKSEVLKEMGRINAELEEKGMTADALSDALSKSRDTYNQQNISVIQLENFILALKKELDYEIITSRNLRQSLAQAHRIIEEEEIELKSSISKLKDNEDHLLIKYAQRDKDQEKLSSAEQEYFKARGKLNEIEEVIRQLTKRINDKQFLINQLKDKLNDLKFRKASIKDRLKIEFEINLNDLLDVEIENEISVSELELSVEKFRRRLDNYGDINPLALEAYNEMEKRFIHIQRQRDDIEEAKISLMKTISEIEDTATKLFMDSFEEVRKHFVVVFRSLFTKDDDCDLVLEEPDDPLNSKIEIIAKPKGKRPKSLSQLSGGEKTLTATALLFSLYLLKPAPFCIFDEVDAPLDDTNIQKFCNIIRAFADKSQFIIVTHNKSTMAEVDVLYGVFMQKKGVSSVSAVDFRNYEEKGTMQTTNLSTYN